MPNYHPFDTTKIVKSEFVTDLDTRYARDLNAGTDGLQNLRRQLRLSANAHVWVKTRDNQSRGIEGKWLIMDGKLNLLISRNGDRLEVYKRPTIENCALEYSYFLEIHTDAQSDKWDIDFPRYIQPPQPNLIAHLRDRQIQQLVQFAKQDVKLYCVDAIVDWRLVVGLGSEHVQETNMTLHHIYGIPYIPGSAVKGVLRHWWLQENEDFINNKGKIDEKLALEDAGFLTVFGSQEQRGEVQFLDAYPDEVNFAIDIMNPHYPDYYSGNKPPTDHQNPVPINFLTVEETTFRFVFLAKDQKPLDELKKRFQKTLEIKGIGAKTAVGYGYFRGFNDQTEGIANELKRQQEAVEKEREVKRIASLSPIEQIAEELNRLTDKPIDENRAVQIYNDELPSLDGDEELVIAQALKDYWKGINKWDGGSDKQRQKVMKVKSILGES